MNHISACYRPNSIYVYVCIQSCKICFKINKDEKRLKKKPCNSTIFCNYLILWTELCSPKNRSRRFKPNLQCECLEIRPLRRSLRLNEVIIQQDFSLIRRERTMVLPLSLAPSLSHPKLCQVMTQWKGNHYNRHKTSPKPNHAITPISDLRPPELWENKLLFKSPSPWYFIMAAWVD